MTPKDAPYKLAQRIKAKPRPLGTSTQLREYQKQHGESALEAAKKVRKWLDEDPAT